MNLVEFFGCDQSKSLYEKPEFHQEWDPIGQVPANVSSSPLWPSLHPLISSLFCAPISSLVPDPRIMRVSFPNLASGSALMSRSHIVWSCLQRFNSCDERDVGRGGDISNQSISHPLKTEWLFRQLSCTLQSIFSKKTSSVLPKKTVLCFFVYCICFIWFCLWTRLK